VRLRLAGGHGPGVQFELQQSAACFPPRLAEEMIEIKRPREVTEPLDEKGWCVFLAAT
jgi:hypothetical protein